MAMMKALVHDKYGSPDVLQIREVEKPTPKGDEVLVKVLAVSINDWDWGLLQGNDVVNRLICGLFRPKKIVGSDIAGRVESAGKKVERFKPGDAVYGDLCMCGFGGFAEYVCVPERALTPKPTRMTFEQAAAIPQAGMLALQGLMERGPLRAGQTILINGAGGGVGTFAIQLAKLHNVEVTGVDSAAKLDMLRSIGFDHVIDYEKEDFTKTGKCYDLILDAKTNRSPFEYARALNPNGTYATVGGSMPRLVQVLILAPWIRRTSKKNLLLVGLKPNKDLAYLNELFEAGKFVPLIDGPYTFREAPEAFRLFGAAKHKGKIVITMD
jgi:NADPH:quinone reductase-like Zn-dependent oxidoreductase